MSVARSNSPVISADAPSQNDAKPIPWWLQTIVVLGALLMTAGAIIALVHPATMVSPQDDINGAVHTYAGYLFSRNLAIAVMLIAAMSLRAKGTLNALMLLTAFIQVLDVVLDCAEGRWAIIPGVAVLGILFLVGAAALSGHPFWKKEAWSQAQ